MLVEMAMSSNLMRLKALHLEEAFEEDFHAIL